MKTLFLILISLLPVSALAQQALTPVRVSIETEEGTPDDRDFNELLQASLNRRGDIAFTKAKLDAKILTATTPVTERGRTTGYSSAVAVLTPGKDSGSFSLRLHIATGGSLREVAEDCAVWLNKELQQRRRK